MSRGRYSQLPSTAQNHADEEMEQAFASDDEDDSVEQPMLSTAAATAQPRSAAPGSYDFEIDYYPPPPGSPPGPSALALPNAIGNSNGFIPPPAESNNGSGAGGRGGRLRDWLARSVGAILPTHYQRIPRSSGVRGGGTENDGVFANVSAKPGGSLGMQRAEDADGIHWAPEESSKDAPPSYASAQADAVPPYWETTILAPSGIGGELFVDGLPAGSLLSFMSNMLISFSFQFVGFMLTSILSTTHAAKFGSRCGLGITLIQYGFYIRTKAPESYTAPSSRNRPWPWAAETSPFNSTSSASSSSSGPAYPDDDAFASNSDVVSANEWLSFLLMTIGWFITLTSALGYYRVKRWERGIQNSTPSQPQARMSPEADAAVRRTLSTVFGFGAVPTTPSTAVTPNIPDEERAARIAEAHQLDARLQEDLRAAGLL